MSIYNTHVNAEEVTKLRGRLQSCHVEIDCLNREGNLRVSAMEEKEQMLVSERKTLYVELKDAHNLILNVRYLFSSSIFFYMPTAS